MSQIMALELEIQRNAENVPAAGLENTHSRSAVNLKKAAICKYLKKKKMDFIAHVARFGIGDRETHIVKHFLLWRPKQWWHRQQVAFENGHPFVHPRVGRIKRFEDQFAQNWANRYSKKAIAEYYGS